MPISDPIISSPLFAAGVLAFALLACISVFVGRRFSLVIFFVALPFISLPLISGRIGGIPGLSIPNIELLLASVLAIWALQLRVPMSISIRRFFLLYLAMSVFAIVVRVLNYEPITIMKLFATMSEVEFIRRSTTQGMLVVVTYLFVAKYCAGTNNGHMLIMRVWSLAVIVFGTAVLGMTVYYFGLYENHNLVREAVQSTIGIHSNEYVLFYVISAPLFLSAITMQEFGRGDKIIFIIALGVSLCATLFSYSRSGYVIMALVVAIYAFVANRRLLWIVIPASVVIGFLLPETVIQRSQTGFVDDAFTGTAGLDSFMAGRNRMWLYTIENFYRDPLTLLFGSGRYTFIPLAYRQFGVMMPHNGYLEVLLDSGIVGFTVIIGFFAYVIGYFRRALAYGGRANRPLYFAALVGLSMFMLICLTGPTFYPAVSHVPVWLLIGLVGGVRQREFLKLGASQVGPAMEKIVLAVGPTITPRAQGRKIR